MGDLRPTTDEEDKALAAIVACVDDANSKFVTPMQATDKEALSAFRVAAADVAALGDDAAVCVIPYSSPDGDGWETRVRLVKGEDAYSRSYQKGPDVTRTHRLVVTWVPGPMTKDKDGHVEDADVPVYDWVERGWEPVSAGLPPFGGGK